MKRSSLEIFDPITCCSSGRRGPNADQKLAMFNAALDWLRTQGMEVRRYDPRQQYDEYLGSAVLVKAVNQHGLGWLPLLVLDGEIVSHGEYPGRAELAALVGLDQVATAAGASRNTL